MAIEWAKALGKLIKHNKSGTILLGMWGLAMLVLVAMLIVI